MAGPFATRGNNSGDLAPVQLRGGTKAPIVADADLQTVAAAGEALGTVAKVNQQRLEREAVTGIQQEIQSVRDALQIAREGTATTEFTSEALKDPYVKQVFEEFTEIQSASFQGKFPQEMALQRMDALLSEAVSRRPQFAEAIRSAANTTAGANISAKFFDQLMQQTPEQQAVERLRNEASFYGVDFGVYRNLTNQQFQRDQVVQQIEFDKAQGTVTLGQLRNQANNMVFGLTQDIMAVIRADKQRGGVRDPQEYRQFISEQVSMIRQTVTGNVPASVTSSDLNSVLNSIDAAEERLFKQLENGSASKLATERTDLFSALSKQSAWEGAPDAMMILDLMGTEQGLKYLDEVAKVEANPTGYKSIFTQNRGGTANLVDGMMRQGERLGLILNGKAEAETDEERIQAGTIAAQSLQDVTDNEGKTTVTPQKVQRLVQVVEDMGIDYSMTALTDGKVAQTVAGFKEVHGQVISVFNRGQTALQRKYNELKAEGFLKDGDIQVRNGQLFVDYSQAAANLDAGSRANLSSAVNTFVRDANLTLRMGQTYQARGVFPETVFKNTTSFLDSLVAQEVGDAAPQSNTSDDGVIRYDIDDNGNLFIVE